MLAYHIDPARHIVTTRVSGRLTPGNLGDYLQRIIRDPKFDASFDAVVVAMDTDSVPSVATAKTLAPLVRSWSARRSGARWAFVLPNEETRTTAELALNEVRLTAVTTRCFLSEAAASSWLESSAAPARTRAAI